MQMGSLCQAVRTGILRQHSKGLLIIECCARAVSETFGRQLDGNPKQLAPGRESVSYTAAVRIAKKGIPAK